MTAAKGRNRDTALGGEGTHARVSGGISNLTSWGSVLEKRLCGRIKVKVGVTRKKCRGVGVEANQKD